MSKEPWNRCDSCGRTIAYSDFEVGMATRRLITPDAYGTREEYETLCGRCAPEPAEETPTTADWTAEKLLAWADYADASDLAHDPMVQDAVAIARFAAKLMRQRDTWSAQLAEVRADYAECLRVTGCKSLPEIVEALEASRAESARLRELLREARQRVGDAANATSSADLSPAANRIAADLGERAGDWLKRIDAALATPPTGGERSALRKEGE